MLRARLAACWSRLPARLSWGGPFRLDPNSQWSGLCAWAGSALSGGHQKSATTLACGVAKDVIIHNDMSEICPVANPNLSLGEGHYVPILGLGFAMPHAFDFDVPQLSVAESLLAAV